jgi:hypothetical protein
MAALMRLRQRKVAMMNTTTVGFIKMSQTQAGFAIPKDLSLSKA